MAVDYIIIGQGICGTWIGYYLLKENKSFIVIDKGNLQSASHAAGGLINPVTGRRVVTTWMAEALLPFVWKEYIAFGSALNLHCIDQKNSLAFPSATDLQQAFMERIKQQNSFIQQPSVSRETLRHAFNFPFDVFEINPCYVIKMQALLHAFRAHLTEKNILREEVFDENELQEGEGFIDYKGIKATKIIYADGICSSQSRYWKNLPFVQNKGQALVIQAEGLNASYTYKLGHLTLVSLKDNVWWAGSSNELDFTTAAPTEAFKARTTALLQSILKKDFTVTGHWSALRPATVERRPFIGFHPQYKNVGILNGMGSKGCSLAPWFARQLVQNMLYDAPLDALADVSRFAKALSR
ncbi:NAD(P)/FAD-dependent oxidoreductase [Parafilimonas sp.]|uniref:NAD(P)/FAD-dependent oxidoreductase n=1 Tax=Parafilimonas sp. TaxID=1969739 RepID=UPI0039E2FAF7